MKFSRVIGKIDPKLVEAAEALLSSVFLELATRYDNDHIGSKLGGDPLIFSLMYPVDHICTLNLSTAATDGKRYFWNPKFVLKKDKIGLRIVCYHEAFHAIYMHPQRRGKRNPKLWNIAVDYIVNGCAMDDLKARKKSSEEFFKKHLGNYMTLDQFVQQIKNPFAPIKGFDNLDINDSPALPEVKLPAPDEDRELTDSEKKELERREKKVHYFYADPNLGEDMRTPERIYDYLYGLLPKCPKCGRIGIYKLPKKDKSNNQGNKQPKDKSDEQSDEQSDQQSNEKPDQQSDKDCDHDQSNSPGQSSGGGCCSDDGCCDECGGGLDIFGLGGTLDDHMDTSENQEKLAKRMAEAMEAAKKMAGYVPGALEDELGVLTAPKVTWKDVVRAQLVKSRAGNNKNDWTKFKTRPMFAGLLVPKRKSYCANFACLLDTSGSMSKDDMAFGISQLQSLDERCEGWIVCCDAEVYWSQAPKIKTCKPEELKKIKPCGRGGTILGNFTSDYEKHLGKQDFLIIISDGFLMDTDIAEMKNPGIPVIWLITSGSNFTPPFGRCFDLHNQ